MSPCTQGPPGGRHSAWSASLDFGRDHDRQEGLLQAVHWNTWKVPLPQGLSEASLSRPQVPDAVTLHLGLCHLHVQHSGHSLRWARSPWGVLGEHGQEIDSVGSASRPPPAAESDRPFEKQLVEGRTESPALGWTGSVWPSAVPPSHHRKHRLVRMELSGTCLTGPKGTSR